MPLVATPIAVPIAMPIAVPIALSHDSLCLVVQRRYTGDPLVVQRFPLFGVPERYPLVRWLVAKQRDSRLRAMKTAMGTVMGTAMGTAMGQIKGSELPLTSS